MKLAEKIIDKTVDEDALGDYKKLKDALDKARKMALKAAKSANAEPDTFDGNEGDEIAGFLKDIWNAFSTGSLKDRSEEDEIFKR
jgi:hypothetical protein